MNAILRPIKDLPLRVALLIAFVMLSILPLIGMVTHAYRRALQISEDFSSAYSLILLRELARSAEQTMAEMERVSTLLFPESEVQNGLRLLNNSAIPAVERTVVARRVENLLMNIAVAHTDIRSIDLISLGGDVFRAAYGATSPYVPLSTEEREMADQRQGGVVWLSGSTSNPLLRLVRLVRDLDSVEPIGYLVISYRERALQSVYQELATFLTKEFNGQAFIVDASGRVVSHPEAETIMSVWSGFELLVKRDETRAGGSLEMAINEQEMYVVHYPIERPPWSIVITVPRHAYDAEMRGLRNQLLLLTGILSMLALAAALALAGSFSKPILKLAEFMKHIPGNGNRTLPEFGGHNEVGVLYEEFQKLVTETERLIRTVYREELLLKRAELEALRMQINPHFLYNTLESINWMARLHNAPDVGRMAKALGDFTRASISGDDFVTLETDLASVRNYLTIQQLRYSDKLTTRIELTDGTGEATLPKLILQPVIENAIVHGVEPKSGPGLVTIHARRSGATLEVEIADDGAGIEAGRLTRIRKDLREPGGEAIGLANVQKRLQFYYGEDYGILVSSKPGEGTVVVVRMPYLLSPPPDRFADESPGFGDMSDRRTFSSESGPTPNGKSAPH